MISLRHSPGARRRAKGEGRSLLPFFHVLEIDPSASLFHALGIYASALSLGRLNLPSVAQMQMRIYAFETSRRLLPSPF